MTAAPALVWTAGMGRRLFPAICERFIPAITATAIGTILLVSEVPPNLIIASGQFAEAFLLAYAISMAALTVKPESFLLHRVALPLGIGAWMGRGGGFLSLVVDLGRYDLLGAVGERSLLVALYVYFHTTEVRRHANAERRRIAGV